MSTSRGAPAARQGLIESFLNSHGRGCRYPLEPCGCELDTAREELGSLRNSHDALLSELGQLREQRDALLVAAHSAESHIAELREAWERGCISEHDGKGGTRSNRNADVLAEIDAAIRKAEKC